MTLRTSLDGLIDLLLPGACLGCGGRVPPEDRPEWVCVTCRTRLRPPPPPRCPRCDVPLGTRRPPGAPCLECQDWPTVLLQAKAAVIMEAPADSLVHALKYEGWKGLAETMARRMVEVQTVVPKDALAVHVPTTGARRRRRGYDQAEVLAEAVASLLGIRRIQALERRGGTTQVHLSPEARRQNVAGKFRIAASSRSRIRGVEVILIDDVLTTGATAIAAASALGEAKVRSVRLLTYARALPFGTRKRR